MRLSYLALDRADLGEPVKCLARSMAKPAPGSLRDLKKVARYLLGTKHLALHLWRQTFPKCISTYVDRDFARCRRSTHGNGADGWRTRRCEAHDERPAGRNWIECFRV